MQHLPPLSPPLPPRARRTNGIALITVLTLLTLLTLLVLSILFTSRVERQSSSLFSNSIEARMLAETSVNLVMGQIRDGAFPWNALDEPRIWTSQPGLIRTFTGERQADLSYRLYSWDPMRQPGDFNPYAAANRVPQTWASNPALFVDLNEPIPSNNPDHTSNPDYDIYPIFYPPELTLKSSNNGSTITQVEGYHVPTENDVVPGTGPSPSLTPVPMPVQWLYVLKDGNIVGVGTNNTSTGSGGEDEEMTVGGARVTVPGATASNPIVGRIAFWADDESAKVNVNTAGGGFGWFPAWFETAKEANVNSGNPYGTGVSLPVRNEFQRYPGHPARTDITSIFPEITHDNAYLLVPRINATGSSNQGKSNAVRSAAITPDNHRFFSSVGEIKYHPTSRDPGNQATPSGARRLFEFTSEWDQLVERRKSFLSASSRAPELTPFGTPKVAAWPISDRFTTVSNIRSASPLDRLIAFCSTLENNTGTKFPYYFTRGNTSAHNTALDAVEDINRARNRTLYHYLQRLTDTPFPGVSSFAFSAVEKYGAHERDQILTQIFDYIRATNITDLTTFSAGGRVAYFQQEGVVMPTRYDAGNGMTHGFGRMLSVRQVGFQFICTGDQAIPASNIPYNPASDPPQTNANRSLETNTPLQAGQRRIQALFLVELFSPSAGPQMFYTGTGGPFKPKIRVKGLSGVKIEVGATEIPLQFPDEAGSEPAPFSGVINVDTASWGYTHGNAGGAASYRWLFGRGNSGATYDLRTTGNLESSRPTGAYPYVSIPVTVTVPADGMMTIKGAPITVEIWWTRSSQDLLLNTVEINLDDATLPLPTLHGNPQYWAFHQTGIFGTGSPRGRFADSGPVHEQELIQAADSVQTYILPHGDYRSLFFPESPLNVFAPVPAGPTSNMRHILGEMFRYSATRSMVGQLQGTTLSQANVPWSQHWAPAMFPPADYVTRYGAGFNAPWTFYDWDTGSPMTSTDGPLINKPDEGGIPGSTPRVNAYTREYVAYNTLQSATYYQSANRQIPSPVMFGSLPTGLVRGRPWQTLLFRPDPGNHPGAQDPPDHLLLELFWMPVVEPYAISEPFSTAGKINLNYQMIPFTYIERASGIHALLKSESIYAVPENIWTDGYGKLKTKVPATAGEFYHPINIEETLKSFRERFGKSPGSQGRVFITPSEITTVPIIPKTTLPSGGAQVTAENINTFWNQHRLTGENIRERIYAEIYPRTTTRSNVFNVHYRVQTLRKRTNSDPALWEEGRDSVVTELRGNTMIERYIDTNREDLPDYTSPPIPGQTQPSAESLYRFRVLTSQEFNP